MIENLDGVCLREDSLPTITVAGGCTLDHERIGTIPVVVLIPGLGGDGRIRTGVMASIDVTRDNARRKR